MSELAPAPSIEQRIRAAMLHKFPFHVVHYARREGATPAAIRIAKGREDVVILGNSHYKRAYESGGAQFMSFHSTVKDGVDYSGKTFIADVLPYNLIDKWIDYAFCYGFKLIVLDSIRYYASGGVYFVGNHELETGRSITEF